MCNRVKKKASPSEQWMSLQSIPFRTKSQDKVFCRRILRENRISFLKWTPLSKVVWRSSSESRSIDISSLPASLQSCCFRRSLRCLLTSMPAWSKKTLAGTTLVPLVVLNSVCCGDTFLWHWIRLKSFDLHWRRRLPSLSRSHREQKRRLLISTRVSKDFSSPLPEIRESFCE